MVNYAELANMDTSKLKGAAEESGGLSSSLNTHAFDVQDSSDIPSGVWQGQDADSAADLISSQPSKLFDASDAFRHSKSVLEELVDELEKAKQKLGDAQSLVAGTGITISADGTVTTPQTEDADKAELNERRAREARGLIKEALKAANSADDEAKSSLSAYKTPTDVGDIPRKSGDTPKDVKKWWDSLSDAEKDAYKSQHPEIIGDLDGIPAADRDEANRTALSDARARAKQEILDIKSSPGYGGPGSHTDQAEARDLEDRKEALDKLADTVNEDPDRMLLGFNAAEDGKAIVASGDPDKADNVLTHVPGMGTELSSVPGDFDKVDSIVSDATKANGDKNTVGVLWFDYDAPDGVGGASSTGAAEDAAGDLSNFQDGLRTTHEGAPSHNTVLGHSYGSTVVGHSLADHNMNADDAVFVGSPGVGVDNVSDLGMDADHVHATRAENDIIAKVPDDNSEHHIPGTDTTVSGHGLNPADPKFGADSFQSNPGSTNGWLPGDKSIDAHSEYWDEGNPSRDTITDIVLGER